LAYICGPFWWVAHRKRLQINLFYHLTQRYLHAKDENPLQGQEELQGNCDWQNQAPQSWFAPHPYQEVEEA
jgi:hypothetical protein